VKKFNRNKIIITATLIVCLTACVLWATVFFVRRATGFADSSSDIISEQSETVSDASSEEQFVIPDALDALLLCDQHVQNALSFSSVTHGTCDTQVMFFSYKHDIYASRFKNEDALCTIDAGFGSMIRYGVSCYATRDARLVLVGDAVSVDRIEWSDRAVSLSQKTFDDTFGEMPFGLSYCVLDRDTVTSAKLKTYTNDTYTFVYELAPTALESYAKRIQLYGALEEKPEIQSVKMTVVMDHDFYPISVTYQENYSVLLPLLGKTTCKTEYTETFSSFEENVSVPNQALFVSSMTQQPSAICPAVSSGYQLLLSLFEDRTVYSVDISAPSVSIPLELSTDLSRGALSVQGDTMGFVYQDDRYYLSYGDVCVYTEATELNRYLSPLFTSLGTPAARASNHPASDLLSGAEIITENGLLKISSAQGDQNFLIVINPSTMSLVSAEFSLNTSDTVFEINISKTEQKAILPQLSQFVDITDSVSSVSFLTTLVGGNDLHYTFESKGALQYSADVLLSVSNGISFSALSTTDDFPIDLYFSDQMLTAVLEEIAVYGSLSDFASLLSFADNGVAPAAETIPLRLLSIEHDKDTLKFFFEGENAFSLVLTSKHVLIVTEETELALHYQGASEISPLVAPPCDNRLWISHLAEFVTDSVYPSLLTAESVSAYLEIDMGQETFDGDLLLNISADFVASFETNWNGFNNKLIYKDNAVYLCNRIFNGYLDVDRLDVVMSRLSSLMKQSSALPIAASASDGLYVTCDGKSVRILYNDIEIRIYKQMLVISYQGITITASDLTAHMSVAEIIAPSKTKCIDIDMLSERLLVLSAQSDFSFAGTITNENMILNVSRLDFTIKDNFDISTAAIDFSIDGTNGLYHLVYDGEAVYFDKGDLKLFGVADTLLSAITDSLGTLPIAYSARERSTDFDMIRSVSFRDDVLEIELDSAVLKIQLSENGIAEINILSNDMVIELYKTDFCPVSIPDLQGYVDITSVSGLLPALVNTANAGNFDFKGMIDVNFLTLSLKGVLIDGTIDYSDGHLKGYTCIEVPYIYQLTSSGIPLRQGNSLLRSCRIKSEIYVLDDQMYILRTIEAIYGYAQPINLVYIEKRYLPLDQLDALTEELLIFVFNLDGRVFADKSDDNDLQVANSYANTNPIKRFTKLDNKYALELNTDVVATSADILEFFAVADNNFVTDLGIKTTFSALDIALVCKLFNHGNALLDFSHTDFLAYLPLQD